MSELHFKAVKGSLLSDPGAPGRYLGRTVAAMPPDGWPAGTKAEDRFPIDPAGGKVAKDQKARWDIVFDALRKGIDLVPADEATARAIGETRVQKRAAAGKRAEVPALKTKHAHAHSDEGGSR